MSKRIMQKGIIDQKILSMHHGIGTLQTWRKTEVAVKNSSIATLELKIYEQKAYHGNTIHIMEIYMMLNNMQLESLNSDKRSRHTRRPKLQQINSFQHGGTLTSGSPLWSKI